MATLMAHLVIGERVSKALPRMRSSSPVYGTFLLGCLLVDVNSTSGLERHQTHFSSLSAGERAWASGRSCATFLRQRGSLLLRPWGALTEVEQAFVAGYLCHLAADEAWLAVSSGLLLDLELASWDDLPVPAEAMLVTFNALVQDLFDDFPAVASVLSAGAIPDVFTHVHQEAFQTMWAITQPYVLEGGGLAAYLGLLELRGRSRTEIEAVHHRVGRHRETAIALVERAGGIEAFIRPAVELALQRVPQLWGRGSPSPPR